MVFRADRGRLPAAAREPALVSGVEGVTREVLRRAAQFALFARPAIVNGAAGLVVAPGSRVIEVVGCTISRGRIVAIDLIADPEKLQRLALE